MKWFKDYMYLVIGGIIVMIVGLVGIFIPYGNSAWNFLFENLFWFPIELGITLLFVEKIIDKSNKKNERIKEYEIYNSVAGKELTQLIKLMKQRLIIAITNETIDGSNDINIKIDEIQHDIESYINTDILKNGINAPTININDIFNPIYVRKSYIISFEEYGEIVATEIEKHLNSFSKFIPMNIFDLLNNIVNDMDQNVQVSRNENLKVARQFLLNREEKGAMQDNDYAQQADGLIAFFNSMVDKINQIEEIINQE
ncbi:hypothetical protein [Enterococcus hirae]|uniref:hypothetical protein n=1 Tax=Enterococcus hirae TaxID=1354 RepID=UPI0038405F70